MEAVAFEPDFAGWQPAARSLLARGVPPEGVLWQPAGTPQGDFDFFALRPESAEAPAPKGRFRVPKEFLATARLVACHRAETTWALLYRVLWRLVHAEPLLLAVATDPDVIDLEGRSKEVRHDVHKMRAFVRFREVTTDAGPWFVAWFEPHHRIVELNAPFFVDRFAAMRWSILTPDRCAHWDLQALRFTPGTTRDQAPSADRKEDLWLTYYRSIFNPARLKVGAMRKEMAPYYWDNLPEAALIAGLIEQAAPRTEAMVARSQASVPPPDAFPPAPVPVLGDLAAVRAAAGACQACPLWRNATCTVFGEGPERPRVVVVGEQPGDQEDRAGRPFVGPAGKLFDRALAAAGVDRSELYVTNAVKHFKWRPQGKRRLHEKPNAREVAACRPWLEQELALLRPELIVCLGATAAGTVLRRAVKVTEERGQVVPSAFGIPALSTVHPSSLLRQPDPARTEADFAAFVADLRKLLPAAP